jgi:DNA (cytosine-5)-methyltransferase 1
MNPPLRYLSICSGIEAATVAWHPLGWLPVGFAEIDKFASAVLAHLFGSNLPGEPLACNGVPNHGDFTTIDVATLGRVDALVGGTPCQAFSFAGRRLSLADARGNLTLAYAVLAHELAEKNGLRNAVWENVPGVLSTDDNAFGCFLGALVGADDPLLPTPKPAGKRGNDAWTYSNEIDDIRPAWPDAGMVAGPLARAAWRVLDAQYFGLAQRRERVFVVVDFGNGADPAAVLFEPKGMQGNSPPRRETGERVAGTIAARTQGGGGLGTDFDLDGGCVPLAFGGNNTLGPIDISTAINAHGGPAGRLDFESETFIAFQGCGTNLSIGEISGTLAMNCGSAAGCAPMVAHTLRAEGFDASEDGTGRRIPLVPVAIAFDCKASGRNGFGVGDIAPTLRAMGHKDSHQNSGGQIAVQQGWAVRRLTPVECARLQGFPDHHSRIPWRGKPAEQCPDGPQYKTFGNSMAVKVMRWLGEKLEAASALDKDRGAGTLFAEVRE